MSEGKSSLHSAKKAEVDFHYFGLLLLIGSRGQSLSRRIYHALELGHSSSIDSRSPIGRQAYVKLTPTHSCSSLSDYTFRVFPFVSHLYPGPHSCSWKNRPPFTKKSLQ